MKLIIASDIHGNVPYTEKLVELIEKEKPDQIILLGDILSSYGMDYDDFDKYKVANLLNKYASIITSVRGNCDGEYDNDLLLFPNHDLQQKIAIDGITFTLTHGHQLNYIDDDMHLLYGHTHRYSLNSNQINPGSVGLPRGGNPHTCIIYSDKLFHLFDLDINKIIETKELL